ncbi:MAG TPA: septum site-determining protein MinC, partial [Polyangia bacterium]
DEWLARTPNFFGAKPVILQMSGVSISLNDYRKLLRQLALRHIRVMAVENTGRTLVGPHLPPLLTEGRPVSVDKLIEEEASPPEVVEAAAPEVVETPVKDEAPPVVEPAAVELPPRAASYFHEGNLRSGQKITNLDGDVTVVGRVASGAEIVAGGAVHVYGALQGRVFAGVAGSTEARIFCREARAEFLCIGEAFVTAEDMDPQLEGKAVEARLDTGRLTFRVLN